MWRKRSSGKLRKRLFQPRKRLPGESLSVIEILDEIERVLSDHLGFSPRLARLARQRCFRRSVQVPDRPSRHEVPGDPDDSAILRAALDANVDYLVTNDTHLLSLHPYESVRIVSMTDYYDLLRNEGLIA